MTESILCNYCNGNGYYRMTVNNELQPMEQCTICDGTGYNASTKEIVRQLIVTGLNQIPKELSNNPMNYYIATIKKANDRKGLYLIEIETDLNKTNENRFGIIDYFLTEEAAHLNLLVILSRFGEQISKINIKG